jgi:hypothetical protein
MDRLKGIGLLAIATGACPCNLPVLLACAPQDVWRQR